MAQPALSAVLWPAAASTSDAALAGGGGRRQRRAAGLRAGRRWVRARAAFAPQTGLATPNGRPQRAAILQSHADALALESAG